MLSRKLSFGITSRNLGARTQRNVLWLHLMCYSVVVLPRIFVLHCRALVLILGLADQSPNFCLVELGLMSSFFHSGFLVSWCGSDTFPHSSPVFASFLMCLFFSGEAESSVGERDLFRWSEAAMLTYLFGACFGLGNKFCFPVRSTSFSFCTDRRFVLLISQIALVIGHSTRSNLQRVHFPNRHIFHILQCPPPHLPPPPPFRLLSFPNLKDRL